MTKLKTTILVAALATAGTAGRAAAGVCASTFNASKTWVYDTPTWSNSAGDFSIGVGAGAAVTGNCDALSIDVSGAIRAKAFSVGGNALEAHLTATTNSAHQHGLAATLYAFGYQLMPAISIASSTTALQDVIIKSYTLPQSAFSGTWSGTFELPNGYGSAGYGGSYRLVADLTGVASYEATPTHLYGGVWGYANVKASATAAGSYTSSSRKITGSLQASALIPIFEGTASATGELEEATIPPVNAPPLTAGLVGKTLPNPWDDNAWRVTARAEYDIVDALRGTLTAALKATYDSNPDDSIPGVSYTDSWDIFSLGGLASTVLAPKSWTYDETVYKPFP